jgi:hypothetical protein
MLIEVDMFDGPLAHLAVLDRLFEGGGTTASGVGIEARGSASWTACRLLGVRYCIRCMAMMSASLAASISVAMCPFFPTTDRG